MLAPWSSVFRRGRHGRFHKSHRLVVVVMLLTSLLSPGPAAVAQEAPGDPTPDIVEELEALRGERSKIFLNSDGSRTGRFFTSPVHYQTSAGDWAEIDTTLIASDRSGYAWRNTAGSFEVHFSATASEDEMVSVTDATSSVTFGFEGADPTSTAVIEGSKITYPSVKPGMDLVYEVREGEVKEFLVLQAAPQQQLGLRFPLTLTNLTAEEAASGAVDLVTSSGSVGFYMSDLWMMDSARDASSAEPGFSENVAATLSGPSSAPTLTVTPDHAWLTSPERVYPVTIDPTITKETTDDTYVQSNILNTDVSGETEMKSGTYDGGGTKARSLLKFADVQSQIPNGATITGGRMFVWESHSYSCTPRDVSAHRITDSWDGNAVRWSTQPGVAAAATTVNVAKGFSSSCGAGWVEFPSLGSMVDYWKTVGNNFGIEIRSPNETTNDWWKRWHATGSGHRPYLEVFYTEPDTVPPNIDSLSSSTHGVEGAWYANTSASFSWSSSDPSGIAGYSYVRDQSSSTNPDTVSEGTGTSASFSGLGQGTHYFHVRAKDNAGNWGNAKRYTFGVDTGAPSDSSISSSTHTRDACSTNPNASFSWSSSDATSGIQGYGYFFDQSPTTTPGTGSVSSLTGGTFSASSDGDWWMHVRAKDKASNLSATSHFKVRINASPPSAPAIASSSHSEGFWSTNRDFSINWSLNDYFGVSGYSYVLDQSSGTVPDTTSEGIGASYSTSGLGDGTHYFHVRALDGCGSWGSTRHYEVRVDGSQSSAPGVSSPSHPSDSTWYSSRSPSFNYLVTDTSGIDGYSYLLDGSSGTTPDTTLDTTSSSYTASGLADGTHYFHVRARNGSQLWSAAGHRAVKIDGTAPAAPSVSSSTHPVATSDYPSNDPVLSWTAPSDLSGIAGYSYVLDQSTSTTPDMTSEGTATSKAYQDRPDGTYYFHVRAVDVAGNWGATTHRRVGILVPAPAVAPILSAPQGQIDPDGKQVVKNGDVLTFGGNITEGTGANAPLDTVAKITTCDLVVLNDAGSVSSRIAVPLTNCRNVDGRLTGSYAPSSFGVSSGSVRLEVVAQRTEGAITKSSGTQTSPPVQIDNVVPTIKEALVGCAPADSLACDRGRQLRVVLSEKVRGDFIAADFNVESNVVAGVNATCTATSFCDTVQLTLATAMDGLDLPDMSYTFVDLVGRQRPIDGTGKSIPNAITRVSDPELQYDVCSVEGGPLPLDPNEPQDSEPFCGLDDPADQSTAVLLPFAPKTEIAIVSSNAQQVFPDAACISLADQRAQIARIDELAAKGDSRTAEEEDELVQLQEQAKKDKRCAADKRRATLAKRVRYLAGQNVEDQIDRIGHIPDVIVLQEVARSDARVIASFLRKKISTPLKNPRTGEHLGVDFRIARPTPKDPYEITGEDVDKDGKEDYVTKSDTAILFNAHTMRRLVRDFDGDGDLERDQGIYVDTGYDKASMPGPDQCKKSDGSLRVILIFDVNACEKRIYKRNFIIGLKGDGTRKNSSVRAAVASTHWPAPASLKKDDTPETKTIVEGVEDPSDVQGNNAIVWTRQMADAINERYDNIPLRAMGGDFNLERCVPPQAEPGGPQPIEPKERQACTPRAWWTKMTNPTTGYGYGDSIFLVHGKTQSSLDKQYEDGLGGQDVKHTRNLRIDFIFASRLVDQVRSPANPVDASHDLTCGEGDTSLDVQFRNCDFYVNKERYSDHRALWSILSIEADSPPSPTPTPVPTVGL